MIVSGRHVPAEEAHRLGIIDELAPEGELCARRRSRSPAVIADTPAVAAHPRP